MEPPQTADGQQLWTPSAERKAATQMAGYIRWLKAERGLHFDGYAALWRWSVREVDQFWDSLWDYFGIGPRSFSSAMEGHEMPGCRWFVGAQVNYAGRILNQPPEALAVIHRTEGGVRRELTFGALSDAVARCRAGLERLGVSRGDRVVGYVTNCPEAVIAFLATASMGAIWSSCPPEFGVESVLDRFSQITPRVLIACRSYQYGGKRFDRSEAVAALRRSLGSLEACVWVGEPGDDDGAFGFDELCSQAAPASVDPMPFDHPLWILFSSGTTGLPKAIVHGHGGMLLEHLKVLALHSDLGPGDRFFWYSTTGWMMWNYLVGGLAVGATIVLYDGSPAQPDLSALWTMAADEKVTYFGASAPYLMACRAANLVPRAFADLSALRAVGSTGAPLPASGFEWVYASVSDDVLLASVSGGTDLCTAFVGGCPLLPVHAGELQCAALGAKVEAFDPEGNAVVGQVGELVITKPMPCMPLYFWNDPNGSRYRESYFDYFPGVWRHGDWIEFKGRGSAVITGRSDATLNRGGVRMGTSDFYRVVEELVSVTDSLVVDTSDASGSGKLWLFVVPAARQGLDDRALVEIKNALKAQLSPRHVPDEIRVISEVPRTLSGKKLEVPIKRLLTGAAISEVVNPGTLRNPEALSELLRAAGVSAAGAVSP